MEIVHSDGASGAKENNSAKTSPQQRSRVIYHFVLPNKTGDHVLAEVLPNGVARFPKVEVPETYDFSNCTVYDALERFIEEDFGISVFLVRDLWNGMNEEIEDGNEVTQNHLSLGDVLDNRPMVKGPFQWLHRNVACKLEWVATNADGDKDHIRTQLKHLFAEINGEELKYYTEPWKNVGWYEKTMLWIYNVLETRNMEMEGRMRGYCRAVDIALSTLMTCEARIRGTGEAVGKGGVCEKIFIKAGPPFMREVERTVAIAGVLGNIVPEIIRFNEQEGIMLLTDVGKFTDEPFDQQALIGTVLKFQTLSLEHISELEAGGLKVRDSKWLEENVDSILRHELLDEYCGGGSDADIYQESLKLVKKFRSQAGPIRKVCRQITNLGLPNTLVHGDLFETNVGSPVRCTGKVYRIFDWAKSFIGNPLHDLVNLLSDEIPLVNLDAGYEQVCEHWKVFVSLTSEEVDDVFEGLGDIDRIIDIHAAMEEYDACKGKDGNWEQILFGKLDECFEDTVHRLSRYCQ